MRYGAAGQSIPRRIIAVRQSIKRREAPGKDLSLFADAPDIQGSHYDAFVTSHDLPMVKVWRTCCGRGRIARTGSRNRRRISGSMSSVSRGGLGHRRSVGLCHSRVQPDEPVSPSGNANSLAAHAFHLVWTGASQRRVVAQTRQTKSVDILRPPPKTRSAFWFLGQYLRLTGRSAASG